MLNTNLLFKSDCHINFEKNSIKKVLKNNDFEGFHDIVESALNFISKFHLYHAKVSIFRFKMHFASFQYHFSFSSYINLNINSSLFRCNDVFELLHPENEKSYQNEIKCISKLIFSRNTWNLKVKFAATTL